MLQNAKNQTYCYILQHTQGIKFVLIAYMKK